MASYTVLNEFRLTIGDLPVHTFNEATADGINASWALTNKPVLPASESVFLDGEIQQNGSQKTTLSADGAEGDTTVEVNSVDDLAVGNQVLFETSADPYKFKILSIDGTTLTLNRALDKDYATTAPVYLVSKTYSASYDSGIILFDDTPAANTLMKVRYYYTKYSDTSLSSILTMSSKLVQSDAMVEIDIEGDETQRALVFLRAHIKLLNEQVTRGASSSIKITQGKTTLDLAGATKALKDQITSMTKEYEDTVRRYQMSLLNGNEQIVI